MKKKLRTKIVSKKQLVFSLLLFFAAIFWAEFYNYVFPRYGADFQYSAEIISIDNFYDEEAQSFQGDQYSQTQFSYDVSRKEDEALIINNVFDVKTFSGEDIFSVSRFYGVDPTTGKHIPELGDKPREGYLFAPTYLEPEQEFTYWHINYDSPAKMKFVAEERLYGLPVLRYKADYSETEIDQTENLSYLPGVPQERGVILEPKLEVWIEPITGTLIKYKDNTVAYYYDINTKEKLTPWNSFSNTYSEKSVKALATKAKVEKNKKLIIDQSIPLIFIFFAIISLLAYPIKKSLKKVDQNINKILNKNPFSGVNATKFLGAILILAGSLVLTGWITDTPIIISILPNLPGMNALTATLFILFGLTLLLKNEGKQKYLSQFICFLIIGITTTRLLAEIGLDFRIDQILFSGVNLKDGASLSAVSNSTAIIFALISYAQLLILSKTTKSHLIALYIYSICSIVSVFGILSYAIPEIGNLFYIFSDLAIHTATIFLIISITLAAREAKITITGFARLSNQLVIFTMAFMLPILSTIIAWQIAEQYTEERLESRFTLQTESIKNGIIRRSEVYINALEGAKGLFAASDEVNRDEWKKYVDSLKLQKNYPGIQGLGYAIFLTPEEVPQHIEEIRAEGFPGYNIRPEGDRDIYSTIVYLEPFDLRNRRAFGFDMFSEENRRNAMKRAITSGEPSMSSRITLVQELETDIQTGFLIYLPVYENNAPTETIKQREESIVGFVYSPFRSGDFVKGIFDETTVNVRIEIFDGVRLEEENQLYSNYEETGEDPLLVKAETIYIAEHPWTIRYFALPEFNTQNTERFIPTVLLLTGSALSILLYITFLALSSSRNRAIRYANELNKRLKKKSENLQKEKAKDEAMLQSIGDGLMATDENGKIVVVNETFTEILGFSEKEIIGKKLSQGIKLFNHKGKSIKRINRPVQKALKKGQTVTNDGKELFYEAKNGEKIPISIIVAPIKIENKIIGCVEIFRDITKEQEIDKAKNEFVSLASHQLRTPLSSIKWYIELMISGEAGKLTKKQKEHLKEIQTGNDRMIELVNSLLNVSRLDLGTFSVTPKKVDIKKIIENIIKEIEPQMKEKNLKLSADLSNEFKNFESDPDLMTIIFQNILTNATKYSKPKGKIDIKLKKAQKGDEIDGKTIKSESLLFTVKDSGFGIPKAQQSKVFDKLFRADNVKEMEGTGLGLYMIKGIIKHSGGEIWFKSEKNKGSTFHISLPTAGMTKRKGTTQIK